MEKEATMLRPYSVAINASVASTKRWPFAGANMALPAS
jgi:hypothetical protein